MSIEIRSEDGKVTIKADDGSTVSDIWVNGKEVVGGRRRAHWFAVPGLVLFFIGALLVLLTVLK